MKSCHLSRAAFCVCLSHGEPIDRGVTGYALQSASEMLSEWSRQGDREGVCSGGCGQHSVDDIRKYFLTDAHKGSTPRRGRRIARAKRNRRSERTGRSTSRAAEGWKGIVLVLDVA